jgi:hypothetical protein
MLKHKGGCLCGCIRYIVSGEPEIAAVCHCRYCQLRTGSAFGSLAYFKDENLKIISGELKKFNFTSESGNKWETYFCDQCGTTIYCLLEIRVGLSGICSGTFNHRPFGLIWIVKYSSDQKHNLLVILQPMIATKLWHPIHLNLRTMFKNRVDKCF